jgi:hypothetical protein
MCTRQFLHRSDLQKLMKQNRLVLPERVQPSCLNRRAHYNCKCFTSLQLFLVTGEARRNGHCPSFMSASRGL